MIPTGYHAQQIMDYYNMQPSDVKGRYNAGTQYHKRILYQKLASVYEFGLPETWDLNWFRFWLFHFGSIAALYTKEYGWIAMPYGVTKLNLYYNPKVIQVSHQQFRSVKTGVIGVNAEIVRLADDYYGLDDLITYYAEILAQIDRSTNVSLMNSNVTMLASVENKKQADDIKEAYGEATTGKPLVTVNKKLLSEKGLDYLIPNVKNSMIVGDLLQARRTIINMFLTDVGIPNFNMDKRAQQSPTEIQENDGETNALCSVYLEVMKECFRRLSAIGGPDITVKLNYKNSSERGGEENGENDPMGDDEV